VKDIPPEDDPPPCPLSKHEQVPVPHEQSIEYVFPSLQSCVAVTSQAAPLVPPDTTGVQETPVVVCPGVPVVLPAVLPPEFTLPPASGDPPPSLEEVVLAPAGPPSTAPPHAIPTADDPARPAARRRKEGSRDFISLA
jgi:hypothetical protein